MRKDIKVRTNIPFDVKVNPIDVFKAINEQLTPCSDYWIAKRYDKYIFMTTTSMGSHSSDDEVRELTEIEKNLYLAIMEVTKAYMNYEKDYEERERK